MNIVIGSQKWKILIVMLNYPDKFFRPEDFMQYGLDELFVGYEAGPRLSELGKAGILESVKIPHPQNPRTFKKRRKIRNVEKLKEWKVFKDYKKYKSKLDYVFNKKKFLFF